MKRRRNQIFNLSFLDLLTSALGAIIFLFVITPRGGQSAAKVHQAMIYFDTVQMKIHGDLHDSLAFKRAGDTLFTVVMDYKDFPKEESSPKQVFVYNEPRPKPKPEVQKTPEAKAEPKPKPTLKAPQSVPEKPAPKPEPAKPKEESKPEIPSTNGYSGDAPSVPAAVSIELNWNNKEDNVDLFVFKNGSWVYGGRRKDKEIGNWDSGKSRNRIFGNDLRTTQEAVRQFDRIIPGEYKIYAQFKESENGSGSITVKGLIYTKDSKNKQRGESFTRKLQLSSERTLIGTLVLQENGQYQFKKS